tara:strand:- start:1493 stop:2536 length:1044 start_codon:yes stop_codon:yes gene_type:complete
MSFLDNAGTIQLDAVLTELGRKRLAQGKFHVAKFALGDDEIDYTLFDPAKEVVTSSGSIGSGDELQNSILSQSCFEAFSGETTAIKYGLTTFNRDDIFFIPILRINDKVNVAHKPWEDRYYFSVNDETTKKLKTALGREDYILENLQTMKTKIIIESGLSGSSSSLLSTIGRTAEYRKSYIIDPGLLDLYFNVFCDSRFFTKVYGPGPRSTFKSKIAVSEVEIDFSPMAETPPNSLRHIVDKFNCYSVRGALNNILYRDGTIDDNKLSSLNGPRGSVLALNFSLKPEMTHFSSSPRSEKYNIFGYTDQTLFDSTNKYDYIDTTIYVEGLSSSSRIQIPLRIIRYAGT